MRAVRTYRETSRFSSWEQGAFLLVESIWRVVLIVASSSQQHDDDDGDDGDDGDDDDGDDDDEDDYGDDDDDGDDDDYDPSGSYRPWAKSSWSNRDSLSGRRSDAH